MAVSSSLPCLISWIDNIKILKTAPYPDEPDVKVEKGFYAWYQTLKNEVDQALFAAANDPECISSLESSSDFRVAVTGHSAGGAVAMLHSYDLLHGDPSGTGGNFTLSSVFTYGSPRVGNEAFSSRSNDLMNAAQIPQFRVTHYRDIVPHMPAEKTGYHHVAQEVWYNEESTAFQVCDISGEDSSCSNTCAPLHCTSIDDHLIYLALPLGSDHCK